MTTPTAIEPEQAIELQAIPAVPPPAYTPIPFRPEVHTDLEQPRPAILTVSTTYSSTAFRGSECVEQVPIYSSKNITLTRTLSTTSSRTITPPSLLDDPEIIQFRSKMTATERLRSVASSRRMHKMLFFCLAALVLVIIGVGIALSFVI
ncbi:uncharacterized protein V2V93DRAFT_377301 [Kockiozyma suomiensis]|uniref:uncharacterized protein n=1 Tax=Kockiozyma suomiensis TaxID=1337062 RepID=UPI0033431609